MLHTITPPPLVSIMYSNIPYANDMISCVNPRFACLFFVFFGFLRFLLLLSSFSSWCKSSPSNNERILNLQM